MSSSLSPRLRIRPRAATTAAAAVVAVTLVAAAAAELLAGHLVPSRTEEALYALGLLLGVASATGIAWRARDPLAGAPLLVATGLFAFATLTALVGEFDAGGWTLDVRWAWNGPSQRFGPSAVLVSGDRLHPITLWPLVAGLLVSFADLELISTNPSSDRDADGERVGSSVSPRFRPHVGAAAKSLVVAAALFVSTVGSVLATANAVGNGVGVALVAAGPLAAWGFVVAEARRTGDAMAGAPLLIPAGAAFVVSFAQPTTCALVAGDGSTALGLEWTWRAAGIGPSVIVEAGGCARPTVIWPFVAVALAGVIELRSRPEE